jgi:hypothetical protein
VAYLTVLIRLLRWLVTRLGGWLLARLVGGLV